MRQDHLRLPAPGGQRELLLVPRDMRYKPGPAAWAELAQRAHL
jgi:hypothetical protein